VGIDVPSFSFALPEGVDPPAVQAMLGAKFAVVPEPPSAVSFTVVDTADRRVGAAGADLWLEPARSEPTMVLRPQVGAAPVEAAVGKARRWMADDLPVGSLREHLEPIIEMRALLPLAQVRAKVQPLRICNGDQKTVVRLRITNHAALDTGGQRVPLTPRVEVTGVLGYPKPLARVVRVLMGEAGLVDAPASMADEAIAASGGDPGGIRSKVKIDLDPAERTDEAALAVLTDLAGMVDANMAGTLADVDTEFLHDLRVAVRRSRSVLRELKGAFAPEPLARQREGLKWIQAITGPTRDLDVQLLDWDALLACVPADRHAALAPVRALLVRHRAAALRALKRDLRSAQFRRTWSEYRAFLSGPQGPTKTRPDARRPVADVAGERIRKVYGKMVALGSSIDESSPAEQLHDLRKRGKELRYLLEFFGGLWPKDVVKPMVTSLKSLQDVLGSHQDSEVQADQLRALAPELAPEPGGPEALLALGTLVDSLGGQQRSARGQFAERFAAFSAPDQRKLVKTTFRGPGG
jgi:CHAD domain-containing protein